MSNSTTYATVVSASQDPILYNILPTIEFATAVLLTLLFILFFKGKVRSMDTKAISTLFLIFVRGDRTASLLALLFSFSDTTFFVKYIMTYLGGCLSPPGLDSPDSFDGSTHNTENSSLSWPEPMILPCRTAHTRLFPKKHSFSYSYLYVGIPVGWKGPAGKILSADNPPASRFTGVCTWFSVQAEDYLDRGRNPKGLAGKLHNYLSSQGISPENYSHAYLVTAPRFLGFSFNPVSFWYLYDQDRKLDSMILEVNNTFDERRMYFMNCAKRTSEISPEEYRFAHAWKKDFHVSPFNDREGGYSLKATNPFSRAEIKFCHVDNTIVLKSAEGRTKIVARVFSTEPGLPALSFTKWQTVSFMLRWWWVGFMTNPRILREAWTLWTKKLQVYYRPEVLTTSIGRQETNEEVEIERHFKEYLQDRVNHAQIAISYIAAAGLQRGQVERLVPEGSVESANYTKVELQILTPAFYSELVRCHSIKETFQRHCFNALQPYVMANTSNPEVFNDIVHLKKAQLRTNLTAADGLWMLLFIRKLKSWKLGFYSIWKLVALPNGKNSESATELDHFVMSHSSTEVTTNYCRAACTVLLADRLALGQTAVLRFECWVIWLAAMFVAVSGYNELLENTQEGSTGRALALLKALTPLMSALLVSNLF